MLTHAALPRPVPDHVRAGRPRAARRWAAPVLATAAALVATSVNVPSVSAATSVQRSPIFVFQPAGAHGGGSLTENATFPPTSAKAGTLKRGADWIQVDLQTSGLPVGAYTVWWIVFATPAGCTPASSDEGAPPQCSEDDVVNALLGNPDPTALSIFWATGGVVGGSGVVAFHDRYREGEELGAPGTQHILGDGVLDPQTAEVHNVIKYHGPASSDPDTLRAQTQTLGGSCESGANAHDFGPPFGVQCFDPQAIVFLAP